MNTTDRLIMEGDKICAYSFKQKKETVFATMTELHSHYAKNAKVSELFNAMKKMEPICGVLIYPESMRKKAERKISEYNNVADIKKYSACKNAMVQNNEKAQDKIAKTRKAHDERKGGRKSPIVAYNLETGEKKEYKTMQNAAARLRVAFVTLQNAINKHQPCGMYFAMRRDDEAEYVRMLPYYKVRYEREIKKCKKDTASQDELVWLRVDAKTEILVPKEKATKKYAEWFNLKRLNPKLPSFDMWNKSKNKEKRK